MFKTAQSDLEANYLKELAKLSSEDKLDFMVEVNELIVGQSELSAFAAHMQKGVVDKLTPDVTGILTTLVLAKVFLRLSRFNYERIEVLYTP